YDLESWAAHLAEPRRCGRLLAGYGRRSGQAGQCRRRALRPVACVEVALANGHHSLLLVVTPAPFAPQTMSKKRGCIIRAALAFTGTRRGSEARRRAARTRRPAESG